MKEKQKIEVGTIIRTVLLALALTNQILTATGHPVIPIDDETITQLISALATVITALVAWWKNNSYTQEAIIADNYMHELKDQRGETDQQ